MKVGMIGCGNMGTALLLGMIRDGAFNAFEIGIYDKDSSRVDSLVNEWGLCAESSIENVIKKSKFILLAIKPADMADFLEKYGTLIESSQNIFISIAAGIKVDFYRRFIPSAPLVRVMPNTPAMVGAGVSALYFDGNFGEEDKRVVSQIFESCGSVVTLSSEGLMDIVTGLSGSGPAYVLTFIRALSDAGVMEGLSREIANQLAIQTVLGTAQMALQSSEHLEAQKDKITSPGGTTIAGLFALEEGKFRATVMNAVKRATEKSRGRLG